MVILRYCYGISRREAGLMPGWERRLLVAFGESVLGIGDAAAADQSASAMGWTADEYALLMGEGA